MKNKCIALLSIALSGATAAYSQIQLNTSPSRSIGQPKLVPETFNPNLVEGRELFFPQGIAVDTSASPAILYVSDTGNNRIMAWKNAVGFSNGQPADLIIGQRDALTTAALGPSSAFSTGLTNPTGLAVLNGDLYVADSGNNRILRFPKPFSQTAQVPDLFIGQPNLNSNTANYTGSISNKGISLAGLVADIAFDSSGNLWMTDPGNRRVLEFSQADYSKGGGGIAASTELGQLDFISAQRTLDPGNPASGVTTNQFSIPQAIAFDPSGRLYVSDAASANGASTNSLTGRVLVFQAPFSNGMSASRILGVFSPTNPPTSNAQIFATQMFSPGGVFFLPDGSVGVVDSGDNRILTFPPFSQWVDQATTYSQPSTGFFGQLNTQNRGANGNQVTTAITPPASASVFFAPTAAVYSAASNELFVTDTQNNRVIVMPRLNGASFDKASRVLGQDRFDTFSINLIEGREFYFFAPLSQPADAGMVIDNSSGTPHLYVADTYNHRVLGFNDLRSLQPGAKADLVIGQQDFSTALCNAPTGDTQQPTNHNLCLPKGLVVDSSGNLYVADSGNGRVLRFPAPFSHQVSGGQFQTADLVLGQRGFFGPTIRDPSASNMAAPYGLTFSGTNGLLVSDQFDSRVLYIPFSAGGTFAATTDNGKPATKVFGQPDFTTITRGSNDNQMNSPHHLASDTNGLVYVADTGNGRVLIFSDPSDQQTPAANARASLAITGLNGPQGVFVNSLTGEVWVTNTNGNQAVRYPKYQTLLLNSAATATIPAAGPTLALAQDQYGNLLIADAANRISIYFPGLFFQNAANFEARPLSPGMYASLYGQTATQFGSNTQAFSAVPLPLTLADTQVIFNGQPAPLTLVSPGQINFYVPMNAPTTGTVDVQVVQKSTGQVFADSSLPMNPVSPGIFICPFSQTGQLRQACVLNQDNSLNSTTNPAARGSVIQIFGTGQGIVTGAPADGSVAQGLTQTVFQPRVNIGLVCFVDDCPVMQGDPKDGKWITYSGLAPGLVGLWQINVQIPMAVAPGLQTPLVVVLNNLGSTDSAAGYLPTIAVK